MGRSWRKVIAFSLNFCHRPKGSQDFQNHAIEIFANIAVSKAEHAIAAPFQSVVPCRIGFCILRQLMLRAIYLDNQPLCQTGKVNDESVDRVLPPKVIALSSEFPQLLPQSFFGDRFSLAEIPSDLVCHSASLSPHP